MTTRVCLALACKPWAACAGCPCALHDAPLAIPRSTWPIVSAAGSDPQPNSLCRRPPPVAHAATAGGRMGDAIGEEALSRSPL